MLFSAQTLNPSEAAERLGVSTKALRLYEERGLLRPIRTEAGWRTYGPSEMARAEQVVRLRGLGLSLAQVGRVLNGDNAGLEVALAEHEAVLESRVREVAGTVARVQTLRSELAHGRSLPVAKLAELVEPSIEPVAAFELPWPWGGERFEVRSMRALNFIIGPLGSGKTRLAHRCRKPSPAPPSSAWTG